MRLKLLGWLAGVAAVLLMAASAIFGVRKAASVKAQKVEGVAQVKDALTQHEREADAAKVKQVDHDLQTTNHKSDEAMWKSLEAKGRVIGADSPRK